MFMLTISFCCIRGVSTSWRGKRHFDLFGTCLAGIVIYKPGQLFGCVYDSIPLLVQFYLACMAFGFSMVIDGLYGVAILRLRWIS